MKKKLSWLFTTLLIGSFVTFYFLNEQTKKGLVRKDGPQTVKSCGFKKYIKLNCKNAVNIFTCLYKGKERFPLFCSDILESRNSWMTNEAVENNCILDIQKYCNKKQNKSLYRSLLCLLEKKQALSGQCLESLTGTYESNTKVRKLKPYNCNFDEFEKKYCKNRDSYLTCLLERVDTFTARCQKSLYLREAWKNQTELHHFCENDAVKYCNKSETNVCEDSHVMCLFKNLKNVSKECARSLKNADIKRKK